MFNTHCSVNIKPNELADLFNCLANNGTNTKLQYCEAEHRLKLSIETGKSYLYIPIFVDEQTGEIKDDEFILNYSTGSVYQIAKGEILKLNYLYELWDLTAKDDVSKVSNHVLCLIVCNCKKIPEWVIEEISKRDDPVTNNCLIASQKLNTEDLLRFVKTVKNYSNKLLPLILMKSLFKTKEFDALYEAFCVNKTNPNSSYYVFQNFMVGSIKEEINNKQRQEKSK